MRSRKFKIKKNFEPLPVEANDELFPNGIFEFNVTKLLVFLNEYPDDFPVEQVAVEEFISHDVSHLDGDTVERADIESPIILAEIAPDRFNVIDGNHRVEKARREGKKFIPAYRVRAEQHVRFLTSERAYTAYVRYWNSKIDG